MTGTKHEDEQERMELEDAAAEPMDADVPTSEEASAGEAEAGAPELESLRAELTALEERHLRLAAEFDNYRKRNERERGEQWARSQAHLVSDLLEVLDDLERVAHVDTEAATVQSLLEGVQLVERKLKGVLEAAGLEPLDAEGKEFDPSTMDALMTVPTSDEAAEDTVADVFQRGYRFKDLLVRPARVRVHKYDPEAEDA